MTLIEKLTMQLTEEQREEFFELIEEYPEVAPIMLFRRMLKQQSDLQEQ